MGKQSKLRYRKYINEYIMKKDRGVLVDSRTDISFCLDS